MGIQAQTLRRNSYWYSSHLKSKYLEKNLILLSLQKTAHLIYLTPPVCSFPTFALEVCQIVYTEFNALQVCGCFSFFSRSRVRDRTFFPFILIFPKGQRQSYSLREEAEISKSFLPSHAWLYMSPLLSSEKGSAL